MKKVFLIIALFLSVVLSSCGVMGNYYSSSIYDDAVYYRTNYRNDRVLAEAKEYLRDYDRDIYALNAGESYADRLNKFKGSQHITINLITIDDPWYNPWWGSAYGWYSPWSYHNYVSWNNHTWLWNWRWNVGWNSYWGWNVGFGPAWYDPWWGGYSGWYDPWYPGYHHWYSYTPYYNSYHYYNAPYHSAHSINRNTVIGRRESVLPARNSGGVVAGPSNGIRSGSSYSQVRGNTSSPSSNQGVQRSNNAANNGSVQVKSGRNEGGNVNSGSVRQGTTRESQNNSRGQQPVIRNNSSSTNSNNSSGSSSGNVRQGSGSNNQRNTQSSSQSSSRTSTYSSPVNPGNSGGGSVRQGYSGGPTGSSSMGVSSTSSAGSSRSGGGGIR